MLKVHITIAWRNILKSKLHAFINIAGLAMGMMVAILIGLWIWDELTFNQYHKNYSHIAQVMYHASYNGTTDTREAVPIPLGRELRSRYSGAFKHIVLSAYTSNRVLTHGDKKIIKTGTFMEAGAPEMLTLHMQQGSWDGLKDPNNIMLSVSAAKALFGDVDPLNQLLKMDTITLNVTGVYDDLPLNSQFHELHFLAPWELYIASGEDIRQKQDAWNINSTTLYVELMPQADIEKVSRMIAPLKRDHISKEDAAVFNPRLFLHPMSQWHLHSTWKNGVPTNARIQFVWLFATIGAFVLMLACINFMNLSTARSEKRAKEVGIRKTIGSRKGQLIGQFLTESVLVTLFAFILAILLAQLVLPFFNDIADKKISILWTNPLFWAIGLGCSLLTGLVAGSYPAFYLSSFQPLQVLKGTFHLGRFAALPRKVLVVIQFTVAVTLMTGTLIVYHQIQFAKDRPIGYNRDGLITVRMSPSDIKAHYDALKNDLLSTEAAVSMTASQGPTTDTWDARGGFQWTGKPPHLQDEFVTVAVTHDYGKTLGWKFSQGRDFSNGYPTDLSSGVILNETAAKFMQLKNPIGQIITWGSAKLHVIGIVKDMVMNSPYDPVKPTIYYLSYDNPNFVILKINPAQNAHAALEKIAGVFEKHNPAVPFSFKFVSDEYARKFAIEERVGKLAGSFALLTIIISCLGLFGLASFVAQQRTKEIGIRKVLGASIFGLWRMLSKEFFVLVSIACLIAIPLTWHFLEQWLQQYEYRTGISLWFFLVAGISALCITLLTVSYQTIKAALMNPVKSLKAE
ncbi:ABC transporter permease [Chitinophaga defluvii]|uniref:ABC transporter permease n=1 Tax=Chitinophaga defluvii TaxID=3163343 RepID=A0ABV2T1R3_9BACT